MDIRLPAALVVVKRLQRAFWTGLLVVLSLPGVLALLTYVGSWVLSKVLYGWLQLYAVHAFVLIGLLLAAALAPFTSLLGALLTGALGLAGRVTGRGLLLTILLNLLSWLGAVLMGLWWSNKISMPGVGSP